MNEELFAMQQKERDAFEAQWTQAAKRVVYNEKMILKLFGGYEKAMPPNWQERIIHDRAVFHAEWGPDGWRTLEMEARHEFQIANTFKSTPPMSLPPFLSLYHSACDEAGKIKIEELAAKFYEARDAEIERTLNELTLVRSYIERLIDKREAINLLSLTEILMNKFIVEAQLTAALNNETQND